MRAFLLSVLLTALAASPDLQAHDGEPHRLPAAKREALIVASGVVRDPAKVAWLQEHYDVWLARADTGQVDVLLSAQSLVLLNRLGFEFTENAGLTATLEGLGQRAPGQTTGIPGYACYGTVEETGARLRTLVAAHPNLARIVDIGDSWEKATAGGPEGYDLEALTIENPAVPGPKAPFVLIGAIHAREYATAEIVTRFAEHLLAGYGTDPERTWLIDHSVIHLLPQTNPDGRKRAEAGVLWRRNTRSGLCTTASQIGVDLNRNSSFLWGTGGSSTNTCSDTYRGPAAASEPEVQAVQGWLSQILPDQRPDDTTTPAPEDATGLFLSLHSYSELVLFPWGATSAAAPNRLALQSLGRKFGHHTRYRVCQAPLCLYAASGVTDDFAYGTRGVAAYTFEVGTAFFQSCDSFDSTVWPRNRDALFYGLKAARRPYTEPQGPEVIEASVRWVGDGLEVRGIADDTRSFSSDGGADAGQPISRVEVSVGRLPFATGATLLPLPAADGSYSGPVEAVLGVLPPEVFAELPPGRQTLYLVATDASGRQGVPTALHFERGSDGVPLFRDGFEP
ncbi:MAG: hypothetical protein MUE46_17965 [Xanthomonadales bacterium]|jgi:hypothetical protein|nr:hypothetical protein [Xanthomonadales bacterium]